MSDQPQDQELAWSDRFQIAVSTQHAYVVTVPEWLKLRRRVRRATGESSLFLSIALFLLGIAAQTFLTVLLVPTTAVLAFGATKAVLWIILLTSLICGVVSISFHLYQKKDRTDLIKIVDEDMEVIEQRHAQSSDG